VTAGSPSLQPHPGKLPGVGLPIVGRRADLDALLSLFEDATTRLVTILGAGGVGKTRLALELAGRLESQFKQGAVFVPLAQLTSIDELLPALASVLGVQISPGGDLQQAVLDHLGDWQALLVLDNFEHMLDEALLINDLLVASPQIKVLVTSREKLGLEAETLYHLGGLELPPPDSQLQAEEYDALQLFLRKARQTRPSFRLNAANAQAVTRICQLVDGNSLGILLAAAWMEHFSPAEIVEQVNRSLDFLSGVSRDAEPRHLSMRAVCASSYNRLDDRHKSIFRKLAVFRGGFDLAAAEAVAGADLRSLIGLADKSLLARNPDSGRYNLHELLRQYAGEELEAANEREAAMAAHARHYTAFVRGRVARLLSQWQVTALDEIQIDLDNIRQACSVVVEKRDFTSAREVLPGIYTFCDMRSRFYEGEAVFRLVSEALAPVAGEAPHPAWALALLSWYDMRAYIEPWESFTEISAHAQNCLLRARSINDPQGIAASQVLLGAIAEDQSEFEIAIRLYEEAMVVCPSLDDAYWVTMRIGLCYREVHKYPEAIEVFEVCLRRGRELGERAKTGWALLNIGDTLLQQKNPVEAQRILEQAHKLFQEISMPLGLLWADFILGRVALELGDPILARERAEFAGQLARQLHSPSWLKKTDDLLRQIDPERPKAALEAKKQGQTVEQFSQRELEVLQLLKSDLSGPDIAGRLFVSLNTVRYHTKNIYQKLGVNTRLEALSQAKELGL
jgi:predicted ATPase/DNA-binding CsgD family transcriptional regulator